jgi:hypothetical protein
LSVSVGGACLLKQQACRSTGDGAGNERPRSLPSRGEGRMSGDAPSHALSWRAASAAVESSVRTRIAGSLVRNGIRFIPRE